MKKILAVGSLIVAVGMSVTACSSSSSGQSASPSASVSQLSVAQLCAQLQEWSSTITEAQLQQNASQVADKLDYFAASSSDAALSTALSTFAKKLRATTSTSATPSTMGEQELKDWTMVTTTLTEKCGTNSPSASASATQ